MKLHKQIFTTIRIVLFAALVLQGNLFATQASNSLPLYEKNHLQIDPFSIDYLSVTASKTSHSQNNLSINTSRPSLLFYLDISDIIVRSLLSINPTVTKSEGSLSVGKLFDDIYELGLYTALNHNSLSEGSGSNENAITSTQLLIGPYFVIYPYVDNLTYLQIYTRMALKYNKLTTTTNGASSNISNEMGVNFNLGFMYSIKLTNKVYYAPNASMSYSVTNDTGGGNTRRNAMEFKIIPISFQMPL